MIENNEDKYSILVPTYNERENISLLIYMIDKYLTENNISYEIIVVEDNSPDNTLECVKKMQKFYGESKIKILSRPGKMGLGSAYIDGCKLCTGNFIFIMDADFSHHPKFLLDFIKKQKETNCDIVTGTRYNLGGGVYGWNPLRKIISRCANFMASFFLRPGVSDLTGSFRLFKKEVFMDLLKKIKNKGYAFQMEIMIRGIYKGYKVEEIPITFVDRVMGKSKLGMGEIIIYFNTVLDLYKELEV
jgi:dolichol-phosphate mannosyltransferase